MSHQQNKPRDLKRISNKTHAEYYKTFVEKMKQFLSLNEQESCCKCFCELFNILNVVFSF